MILDVKKYKLNKDFGIICTTYTYLSNRKTYRIDVVRLGLPFDLVLEKKDGFIDKDVANRVFKGLCLKYKFPMNLKDYTLNETEEE